MSLRGVNLGGWLVLEPWITPSLFADTNAKDEYSFCQLAARTPELLKRLKRHRDSFITEQDFVWLAQNGIQTLRLPVGYWLFGNAKPYQATSVYVDRAFKWADKHGLTIILDVHGLPGSQNGEFHSGKAGSVDWHTNPAYVAASYDFLQALAERYGHLKALAGISIVNEPSANIPVDFLQQFYQTAYQKLQKSCKNNISVICSDGFRPAKWRNRLLVKKYPFLQLDYHHYQLFGALDGWLPAWLQVWRARYILPIKLQRMTSKHRVIIGEWSLALPAARWPLSARRRQTLTAAYAGAQLRAFERAGVDASYFWTYKTEAADNWSYQRSHGIIQAIRP